MATESSGIARWNQTPIAELIKYALAEPDEDKASDAVAALHLRGTRDVFDAARDLCASDDPERRALGADILGQLGTPDRPFLEESVDILLRMLATEHDPGVLYSIAIAFGQLQDSRGIEPLLRLVGHPDALVREGVAFGLGGALLGIKGRRHDDAIHALIGLTTDEDVDVRDFATTALACELLASVRMPEINEALLRRVSDEDAEVRAEALLGLAFRKDRRIVEPLGRELSGQITDHYDMLLLLEAAAEIADPSLCPVLQKLKDRGLKDEMLNPALAACRRGTPAR